MPKANISTPGGEISGSVNDSCFAISFGVNFGEGKWRNYAELGDRLTLSGRWMNLF